MIRRASNDKTGYFLLIDSYSFPRPGFTLWWWRITGEIPLLNRGNPERFNIMFYIRSPWKTRKKKNPIIVNSAYLSFSHFFYSQGGISPRGDYEKSLMKSLYTYVLRTKEYPPPLLRVIILELKQRRYAYISN